jgi:(2Fe-2S) ferredoxin
MFYSSFRLVPKGRHEVTLCMGTVCHLKGAPRISEAICTEYAIQPGGTTADRLFTLQAVNCVGACALAPVMVVDGKYYDGVTPDSALQVLRGLAAGAEEAPPEKAPAAEPAGLGEPQVARSEPQVALSGPQAASVEAPPVPSAPPAVAAPEAAPQPEPQPQPAAKAKAKSKPKAAAQPKAAAKAAAGSKPKPEAKAAAEPKPKAAAKAKGKPKPATKAKAGSKPKPAAKKRSRP